MDTANSSDADSAPCDEHHRLQDDSFTDRAAPISPYVIPGKFSDIEQSTALIRASSAPAITALGEEAIDRVTGQRQRPAVKSIRKYDNSHVLFREIAAAGDMDHHSIIWHGCLRGLTIASIVTNLCTGGELLTSCWERRQRG
ncbi:hypothetical protein ACHAW5_007614 [Stephanodiscus triporus]|uniref:Uncharacterized protein n=1 Tax=Stephanodiscus triporus TaxID=2934178 RepID=A0ABD3MU48_9STRA